jgi:Flp pilus assembly protein TadD
LDTPQAFHPAARPVLPSRQRATVQWRAGIRALHKGDFLAAVSALRLAIQLEPALGGAHNDLGVLMEALGNPSEAICCYRQALAADPKHADARRNLGMLLMQMDLARALSRAAV